MLKHVPHGHSKCVRCTHVNLHFQSFKLSFLGPPLQGLSLLLLARSGTVTDIKSFISALLISFRGMVTRSLHAPFVT